MPDDIYWEVYDNQNPKDFEFIAFNNRKDELVTQDIIPESFDDQLKEIIRTNGRRTVLRVCRHV